jgi:secondary thiamine-phosphate synthase enzyme
MNTHFHQDDLVINTRGRGTLEITDAVDRLIAASGIDRGLATVFLHHTSASLILCENADPTVRHDLETFLARLAPDGDPRYAHDAEGPDDMPAHIRSMLTQNSLAIPVRNARLDLYEHRARPHRRRLSITILGTRS